MPTISKQKLVDRIAEITGVEQGTVKTVVLQFLDEITTELAHKNRLEFRDFGVFEPQTRAPKKALNPKTLERVHVPAQRTVKFKMGRMMREKWNDDRPIN